jgi:hypothetical protein
MRLKAIEEKNEMEEKLKSQLLASNNTQQKLDKYKRKYQKKMEHMKEEMKEQRILLAEEKNHLLSQIRSQNRDVALLTMVLSKVLSPSEMSKMWTQSQWDEEEERWIVPHLQFNNRWGSSGGAGNHCVTRSDVVVDTKTTSSSNKEEQEKKRRKEKRRRKKKKEMMMIKKKQEDKEENGVMESMF